MLTAEVVIPELKDSCRVADETKTAVELKDSCHVALDILSTILSKINAPSIAKEVNDFLKGIKSLKESNTPPSPNQLEELDKSLVQIIQSLVTTLKGNVVDPESQHLLSHNSETLKKYEQVVSRRQALDSSVGVLVGAVFGTILAEWIGTCVNKEDYKDILGTTLSMVSSYSAAALCTIYDIYKIIKKGKEQKQKFKEKLEAIEDPNMSSETFNRLLYAREDKPTSWLEYLLEVIRKDIVVTGGLSSSAFVAFQVVHDKDGSWAAAEAAIVSGAVAGGATILPNSGSQYLEEQRKELESPADNILIFKEVHNQLLQLQDPKSSQSGNTLSTRSDNQFHIPSLSLLKIICACLASKDGVYSMTAIAAFLVGLFSNTTISQSTPLQSLGDQTSINLEYLKLWVTIPAMLITFTGMSILSFLHNSEVLLQQGDDATQELKYSLNPEYSSVPPQLVKLKAYVDRNSNTDTTKETQLMRLGRILLSVGKSPTTLEVIIDVTTLAAVPLLLGDMANLTTLERMGVALAVGTTSGTITTAATAFVKAQTAKLTRLAEASLSAAYNSSTSSVYNAAQDTGHMSTGILKCVSTFFYRCMWGHQNSENVPLVASTSHPQEPKPTQSYSSIQ